MLSGTLGAAPHMMKNRSGYQCRIQEKQSIASVCGSTSPSGRKPPVRKRQNIALHATFSKIGRTLPAKSSLEYLILIRHRESSNFCRRNECIRESGDAVPSILHVSSGKIKPSFSYNYLELLVNLKEYLKRQFNAVECTRGNWSVRELNRRIAGLYYERSGLFTDKKKLSELATSSKQRWCITESGRKTLATASRKTE